MFPCRRSFAWIQRNASRGGQAGTSDFRFPALDPATESFLWRRKADLEAAIAAMPCAATEPTVGGKSDQATAGRAQADLADAMTLADASLDESWLRKRRMSSAVGGQSFLDQASAASTGVAIGRGSKAKGDEYVRRRSTPQRLGASVGSAAAAALLAESTEGARGLQLAMIRESFRRLDKDGDGYVTPCDLAQAFRFMGRDNNNRR